MSDTERNFLVDERIKFANWFAAMVAEEVLKGNLTAAAMTYPLEGVYWYGWLACAKLREGDK